MNFNYYDTLSIFGKKEARDRFMMKADTENMEKEVLENKVRDLLEARVIRSRMSKSR